jgi:predicted RNA binding protein YcfA (HicA-like mRNA interferase family)
LKAKEYQYTVLYEPAEEGGFVVTVPALSGLVTEGDTQPSDRAKSFAPLERVGFTVHHVTGSHHILRHPDHPNLRVTVPMHHRDLKRGTLAAIIKTAGLSLDDFLGFL